MKMTMMTAGAIACLAIGSTYAQRLDVSTLASCKRTAARLSKQNAGLKQQLRSCATPDYSEVRRLRDEISILEDRNYVLQNTNRSLSNENQALINEADLLRDENSSLKNKNRRLRKRIAELTNNNRPTGEYFCSAACTDFSGNIDFRYLGSGVGSFDIEAENRALQAVQSSYSCNFGAAKVSCEQQQRTETNYCVAACTDFSGKADNRYSKGSMGKSKAEAEFNAMKLVQESFTCNFGITVTKCSNR